jgi:hypothetical protein
MRQFYTSVTDLRESYGETFETFPFEAGWASEAIYFVTAESETPVGTQVSLRVQLSPDGVRWVDEGTTIEVNGPSSTFARVTHFGGFLRLVGEARGERPECTLTVRLALKE